MVFEQVVKCTMWCDYSDLKFVLYTEWCGVFFQCFFVHVLFCKLVGVVVGVFSVCFNDFHDIEFVG